MALLEINHETKKDEHQQQMISEETHFLNQASEGFDDGIDERKSKKKEEREFENMLNLI